MISCQVIELSLPKSVITEIDFRRGDVTRSRYVTRLLENLLLKSVKEVER
jgi:hypothetical protein